MNKNTTIRRMKNARRIWLILDELYGKDGDWIMNCSPKMVKTEYLIEKVLIKFPNHFENKAHVQSVLDYMDNDLETIWGGAGGVYPKEKGREFFKLIPFYNKLVDTWGFWTLLRFIIPFLLAFLGKEAINSYYEYKIVQIQQNQTINNQFIP